jgi:hypothetical protein
VTSPQICRSVPKGYRCDRTEGVSGSATRRYFGDGCGGLGRRLRDVWIGSGDAGVRYVDGVDSASRPGLHGSRETVDDLPEPALLRKGCGRVFDEKMNFWKIDALHLVMV